MMLVGMVIVFLSLFLINSDLHFEIRKAGIQHLNNHPEYFIESISDNN